ARRLECSHLFLGAGFATGGPVFFHAGTDRFAGGGGHALAFSASRLLALLPGPTLALRCGYRCSACGGELSALAASLPRPAHRATDEARDAGHLGAELRQPCLGAVAGQVLELSQRKRRRRSQYPSHT